jgi:hypothetical protein
MNHPWMFVIGMWLIGFALPEVLNIWRVRVPIGLNLLCAIAAAMIAGAFVL